MRVWFEDVPRGCAPDRIRLTVDVNDDLSAPGGLVHPVAKTRKPFVVGLHGRLLGADVISASSISTELGSFSKSVPVAISVERPPDF